MIEKLTIEKLNEYNFETDIIDRLLSSDDYEQYTFNDIGYFFASNVEQKIYSDKEALRKYYFKENEILFPYYNLDLIPEYYKLLLKKYLAEQKIYLKTIYNEQTEINEFKQLEIDNCNTTINYYKEKFKNRPKTEIIKKYKEYLKWLENKEPQQSNDLALNTDKNESKEPVNKLPPKGFEKIFTENINVWNVFSKLVEVIVESKPKRKWYAQFSVIFQTLIETKVIPRNRHALYLKFCDENYETDFTHYKKLKSNTSNHSTQLIKSYLKDAKLIN